jgi:hypothetical protein
MNPLQTIGLGVTLVAVLAVPAAASSVSPLADDVTEANQPGLVVAESPGEDPGWLTPQSIEGVGRFTMHGPKVEGDRIRFELDARTARTGLTHGRFSFRHHSPATVEEPTWTSHGYGRVICLSVSGNTALLTTAIQHEVVPGKPDGIGPHAYYMKITNGAQDHVSFIQGPPPPAGNDYNIYGCSDPETVPDIPIEDVDRYFLEHGDWSLRGPAK